MSRMERYEKIHKKAKPIKENESIFARRERKQRGVSEEEAGRSSFENQRQEPPYQQPPQQSSGSYEPPEQPPGKIKKPRKPKRKRPWRRRIVGLLLLIFLLAGGSFFFGRVTAQHDNTLPNEEVQAFHGSASSDGGKNILILGSDSRGEDTGRADTIMVLHLGRFGGKPKLVSFMRDSFVSIPGVGDNKINAAYAYGGADLVRQTLAENFGIDCQYYAKVDFQSFEKVIDALFLRGVTIDAEKDLNLDGVDIKKGTQRMDGHTLLQYARFRKDEEGDFGRVRRQQQVMNAVFSQLKNPLNLLRAPYAAGKAVGYLSTDLPDTFFLTHLLSFGRAAGGIDRLSVPVEGSWNYGTSDYAGSILVIDTATNKQAIHSFFEK